ncbi:uncharacterized protein LOC8267683 [Ricinus communis]|uniref:Uncharacterized protein n=1 Tax=Ricinus communis TaxID=3988 RepID=B9SXA0_RICCO|nr:uncharacterized protein LOC8267683 [Ricinus communis]EEF31762.1 conserved hypothetical protein [Ricinus communis]|eukprot:XP_002530619.1 uncharacterized protein LOC8267683 [Ricinus communis]
MCCGGKMCMLCTCVILVVIAIGLIFGFGVYKNGFHKLKDSIHVSGYDPASSYTAGTGRPFLGYGVPPAPF